MRPQVITPPKPLKDLEQPSLFLAGTIDMGASRDWQKEVINHCRANWAKGTILNPRRDDWDPTWEQKIENALFKGQVDWELEALLTAKWVAFNFEAASKSPVTMLELGLVAGSHLGQHVIVHCPEGFWRKGNVDIVVQRFELIAVKSFDEFLYEIGRAGSS